MPRGRRGVLQAKVNLKMSAQRMTMLGKKLQNASLQRRREIAQLLSDGKEESARIKVEYVIRDELTCQAYEMMDLFVDLLVVRLPLLDQSREVPGDLVEALHSVLYASTRLEVQELKALQPLFSAKFGKEYVQMAMENGEDKVNPRLVHKLAITAPETEEVHKVLARIAKEHKVDWKRKPAPPSGPPPSVFANPAVFIPDDLAEKNSERAPAARSEDPAASAPPAQSPEAGQAPESTASHAPSAPVVGAAAATKTDSGCDPIDFGAADPDDGPAAMPAAEVDELLLPEDEVDEKAVDEIVAAAEDEAAVEAGGNVAAGDDPTSELDALALRLQALKKK